MPYLQVHNGASQQCDGQKYRARHFEYFNFAMSIHIACQQECEKRTQYGYDQQWHTKCPVVCGQTRCRTGAMCTSGRARLTTEHIAVKWTLVISIFQVSHFHYGAVETVRMACWIVASTAQALVCAACPTNRIHRVLVRSSRQWPMFALCACVISIYRLVAMTKWHIDNWSSREKENIENVYEQSIIYGTMRIMIQSNERLIWVWHGIWSIMCGIYSPACCPNGIYANHGMPQFDYTNSRDAVIHRFVHVRIPLFEMGCTDWLAIQIRQCRCWWNLEYCQIPFWTN